MTKWLEHHEKVQLYSVFINWRQQQGHDLRLPSHIPIGPPSAYALTIKMMRHPSKKCVYFDTLASDHGALDFQDALADFITQLNYPGTSRGALADHAHNTHIPFSHVPVYHKIKFTKSSNLKQPEIVDTVHVRPEHEESCGQIIPACFNTVLMQGNKGIFLQFEYTID